MNQPPQPPGGQPPQPNQYPQGGNQGNYSQPGGNPNQYSSQPQGAPNQYGQPQGAPNQYGGQPQGGYGQPQGQYGGPGAYPPQYPPGAPYPVKRGPGKGLGVVKLLVGGCFTLGMIGGLSAGGYNGIGVSAVLGLVLGVAVWMTVSGIMNLIGKKLPMVAGAGVVVACAVLGAVAGPPISAASYESQEETAWNELTSLPDEQVYTYMWDIDYFDKIPEPFQREEAQGWRKYAEVREAIRNSNLVAVRDHIADIKQNHAGDENYRKAFNAASGALKGRYDEVLAKLGQPGVQNDEAEFPVDEELRKAFKTVLADLAEAPTPDVYVAFTNKSDLTPPEGHEEVFNDMLESDSVKRGFPNGDVPVIDPGDAFSAKYDAARRGSFIQVSGEAFRKVFDANLLALKPLGDKETRDGKLVLQVSSEILRTRTYFDYYNTNAAKQRVSKGLLFGIAVVWELKLFDREGKLLYEKETFSTPGSDLYIDSKPTDPKWAVYSILMDSAYYNYSREIIGSFGLVPPAIKQSFAYSNYGVGG
ncbi:MAG: hypothetical protein KDB29_11475 [Planctomycetes bacterium]|nr:hypothetical protein [Planctomycetota bacterium]